MKLLSVTTTFSAILEIESDYQLLRFNGFLDAFSVPIFNIMMDKHIKQEPENLILDLSKVEFLDSSGLGALVRLVNNFNGNTLVVAQGMIAQIIDLLGLTKFLSLQSTLTQAISKLE
jgi:anti-anti-sigma factor